MHYFPMNVNGVYLNNILITFLAFHYNLRVMLLSDMGFNYIFLCENLSTIHTSVRLLHVIIIYMVSL